MVRDPSIVSPSPLVCSFGGGHNKHGTGSRGTLLKQCECRPGYDTNAVCESSLQNAAKKSERWLRPIASTVNHVVDRGLNPQPSG